MGLLDRFRPSLTVSADGNELIFRLADTEVREQPIIRVAPDGKIIEVGVGALDATGGRLIRLLTEDGADNNVALRAFCRYLVFLASQWSLGPRPRVTIIESSIRRVFGRDATTQLYTALVQGGFAVNLVTGV